ncbi:alpha/beta fold hydrolase [Motiliproteus sediminis]|uniref:alpha/beta fold hydrolase n=1 Tax=Motiliproteus sediminis TaxID=1468178 RepID=UPI001AEF5AA7|nr:alpha/beta hydrolase [Motiliproteus sediminis]
MTTLITSDQCPLNYQIRGSGPCVIFLHGWSSSALEWLPFAEALSHEFRVICWNARGHGLQQHPENTDVSLDRMADDLDQLLTREAPEGALVVGHSMGALTAWNYVRRHGCQRLRGLCIVDQSPRLLTGDDWQMGVYGRFCAQRNDGFIRLLQQTFPDAVCRLIFSQLDDPDQPLPQSRFVERLQQYLASLPADLLIRCWKSLTEADLRDTLPLITVPTLLIYGERSQFYSRELAQWVHRQITDSELHIYPDADHSPHVAQRERFIADLRQFAAGLPQPVAVEAG